MPNLLLSPTACLRTFWFITTLSWFTLISGQSSLAEDRAPTLADFIEEDGRIVYVGLFQDEAIELKGCQTKQEAANLLDLQSHHKVLAMNKKDLKEQHALFSYPAIPCNSTVSFDSTIPANMPLWADREQTRKYFLTVPKTNGTFLSIPFSCRNLVAAFGIRKRYSQPEFFHDEPPPSEVITKEIALGCGKPTKGLQKTSAKEDLKNSQNGWALEKAEIFLDETKPDYFIYVASYSENHEDSRRSYFLPIYSIDGEPSHDIIWEGSERTENIEKKLMDMFSVDSIHDQGEKDFSDLIHSRSVPLMSVCFEKCKDSQYRPKHFYINQKENKATFFLIQNLGLSVTTNNIGQQEQLWNYSPRQSLSFENCSTLTQALSLTHDSTNSSEWLDSFKTRSHARAGSQLFKCHPPQHHVCRRAILDSQELTARHFQQGETCAGKIHLILEITGNITQSQSIGLDADSGFHTIEIKGLPFSDSKAKIVGHGIKTKHTHQSGCLFEPLPTLFFSKNITLRVSHLDIVWSKNSPPSNTLAFEIEGGSTILHQVNIGLHGSQFEDWGHGLRLCQGILFANESGIRASQTGMHAMRSKLSFHQSLGASSLQVNDTGISLHANSLLRLHQVTTIAGVPIDANNSIIYGEFVNLQANDHALKRQGLRLTGPSHITLKNSSLQGFENVARIHHPQARVNLLYPTNDLQNDNKHVHIGKGTLNIVE